MERVLPSLVTLAALAIPTFAQAPNPGGFYHPVAELDAGYKQSYLAFGRSLACEEGTLAVTSNGGTHVFQFTGPRSWTRTRVFTAGSSVDLEGDTLVVGDDFAPNGGTVSVHERNAGGPDNWGRVQVLPAPPVHPMVFDRSFGQSIELAGELLVVGDPMVPVNPVPVGQGSAFVYERDPRTRLWTLVRELTAPGFTTLFGRQVAADGDLVAATGRDSRAGVWIFDRNQGGAGAWGFVTRLGDQPLRTFYGIALDLEDGRLLIGDPGAVGSLGQVFVHERHRGGENAWGLVARLAPPARSIPATRDFGRSVELDGRVAVVGDPRSTEFPDIGVVHVFERDAGGPGRWGETARIQQPARTAGDRFGDAVGSCGRSLFVGADWAGGRVPLLGAVFVFRGPATIAPAPVPPRPVR